MQILTTLMFLSLVLSAMTSLECLELLVYAASWAAQPILERRSKNPWLTSKLN